MFTVTLPGIITADRLAEVREGFEDTIKGMRVEPFGLDMCGFDVEDGQTVFVFDSETEAAKFRMMRG